MSATVKNTFAGYGAVASPTPDDDAEHVVHGILTLAFDNVDDADLAREYLVHVAQTAMILTEAYVVPCVTTGTDGTNYVTLTLGKGNLANGALTSFDSMTTNSSGGAALTISTKRSFTIVESTDTLAKGDGLYLHLAAAAAGAVAGGTLVVHYKLAG